jgi:hypothetical protein
MGNSKAIILTVIAVLAAFTGIVFVLDIDFARWFTCNGPLANQQDKNSDVCKRLDKIP